MLHLNIDPQNLHYLISLLTRTAGAKLLAVIVLNDRPDDKSSPFPGNPTSAIEQDTPAEMLLNSIEAIKPVNYAQADNFSAREREIIKHLLKGLSHKMIADELSISINTVRNHITKIYRKMDVHSAQQALARLTGLDAAEQ